MTVKEYVPLLSKQEYVSRRMRVVHSDPGLDEIDKGANYPFCNDKVTYSYENNLIIKRRRNLGSLTY